eukprot:1999672-Rhodomonas_salina.1
MSGAPAATPPAHTGAPSKLDRWLQRSSPQASTVSTPPASDKKEEAPAAAPAAAPPANAGAKSKLDRWLQRSNAPQTPTYTSPHTAVQKPQKGSAQASMVSAVPHDPAKSPITSVGPSGPVTPRADGSTMLPVATPPQEPPATTWCVAPPPASSCSALLLLLAQNRHSQEKCARSETGGAGQGAVRLRGRRVWYVHLEARAGVTRGFGGSCGGETTRMSA